MELCIKIVDTGIEICYYLKSYAFVGGIMYWDEINMAFDEVRKASNTDEKRLSIFAEECHDRLCEMLGEEGSIMLEQYICCLELLGKRGEFHNK